ncbi:tetratricopeptide repeat family protein [Minicystis rosea]|nr:tetratricopeptide repeat family protein [Minicystis rosea]
MTRAALIGPAMASLAIGLVACGTAPPPLPAPPPEVPVASATATAAPVEAPSPPPLRLPCASDDLVGCIRGCDEHVTEDCVILGVMYLNGAVVTIDAERGVTLFRSACADGSARGCLKLGDAHHAGLVPVPPGRKVDVHAEEVSFYLRACDGGANLGCLAAGRAYVDGHGGPKDPAAAAQLFERICSRGNAAACFELGRLFQRGEGVASKPERAIELFRRACQLGLDEGCFRVEKRGEEHFPRR